MTTTKTRAPAKSQGARPKPPVLPVMSVQRFEESLELVERIAKEERGGFLREMQAFRQEHRDITQRPLTATEAAEIASTLAAMVNERPSPGDASEAQGSDLYVYEDPAERDVLVAAGMATAPALVRAVRRFVALMEMSEVEFEQACEAGQLPTLTDEHAKALGKVSMSEARERQSRAMSHWAKEVGVGSGEVMRRLVETVMGALEQAAIRVSAQASPARSHLSTSSPAPTDGADATSSTTSPTATP
jgi:hypothetical protein